VYVFGVCFRHMYFVFGVCVCVCVMGRCTDKLTHRLSILGNNLWPCVRCECVLVH
jgi:hypothetical protein